jgi:hypothetical protein
MSISTTPIFIEAVQACRASLTSVTIPAITGMVMEEGKAGLIMAITAITITATVLSPMAMADNSAIIITGLAIMITGLRAVSMRPITIIQLLRAAVNAIIHHPATMVYGEDIITAAMATTIIIPDE